MQSKWMDRIASNKNSIRTIVGTDIAIRVEYLALFECCKHDFGAGSRVDFVVYAGWSMRCSVGADLSVLYSVS